ncbi:MAG: 4-(cytidine 5'-diphospho)-2-C-methyl-D-erythritol kinase, partial [Candidatus Eisenbacteria bacterium]|nr:4-(cytidine 5'-diphospho)-2-C-methyl-D-erythritol kinase [Candidatus Eisenbacteria bacterium]
MTRRFLSYAKFNVYLAVLGRRADGYHELDTLLQALSLADTLTFTATEGTRIEVSCDDPRVPADGDNLVGRALALLRERHGVRRGMRVQIAKRIPPQAGLGGGSGNAACALAAANLIWRLDLPEEALERLAAEIGSDAAFFIRGGAQRGRGRGERLAPTEALPDSRWIVVKPPWGLETGLVYRGLRAVLTPPQERIRMVLEQVAKRDPASVARSMFNDLESAARGVKPEVGEVRAWMADQGLDGAVLAGSGSAW